MQLEIKNITKNIKKQTQYKKYHNIIIYGKKISTIKTTATATTTTNIDFKIIKKKRR